MTVEVKICGVTRPEDALAAARAGATWVGVILSPGYGRSVTPILARRILDGAADARRVGVMVDPTADEAVEAARRLALDVVQLHGLEPPHVVEAVSGAGPWEVWKAIRVGGGQTFESLAGYRPWATGALVDAWDPDQPGGAGRGYPWEGVAAGIRAVFPDGRFVAAGGLTPDNVADAIRALHPDVVDVSSGVEAARGVKDPEKIRAFVDAATAAAAMPQRGDHDRG